MSELLTLALFASSVVAVASNVYTLRRLRAQPHQPRPRT